MCGRFTLRTPLSKLVEQFEARSQIQLPLRFNIAPTQMIAAVRCPAPQPSREIVLLHWGLIPSWADDPAIGNRMINARAESVADKPSFRNAFKRRRCLVLADGYYEWQKQGKKKQPFYIHRRDDRPFAFAGLWEIWQRGEADPIESCTIITTDANELTRPIHDRMPVILDPQGYSTWLNPEIQDRAQLEPLLVPAPSDDLVAQPVSTLVNNPRHEDPSCIQPIGV